MTTPKPVVVIGAGPVGLAAAAHLAARERDFVVLEALDGVAANRGLTTGVSGGLISLPLVNWLTTEGNSR